MQRSLLKCPLSQLQETLENKMLKDQKIVCDDTLYMVYKKEGTDEWEAIDLDGTGGEPKPVAE